MNKVICIKNKIKDFNKTITVDGDKSLSIRWALLASQANGKSTSKNLLKSEDVLNTLKSEQVKIYKVPAAVDSLQNIIDSLQSEAFSAQTQNGRYELSLEHLYEVNPKAGKEFTNFMEHETE